MSEDIIVIYPPGTGGHHIANLISLDPAFNKRCDTDEYNEQIVNTHFKNSIPYQLLEENIINSSGVNVWSGHLGEWLWAEDAINRFLWDPKYLIIEMYPFPIPQIVKNRICKLWPAFNGVGYFQEVATLYRKKNFERFENDSEVVSITVEDVFQGNGKRLIELLNNKLGINIDIKHEYIHNKWFKDVTNE